MFILLGLLLGLSVVLVPTIFKHISDKGGVRNMGWGELILLIPVLSFLLTIPPATIMILYKII